MTGGRFALELPGYVSNSPEFREVVCPFDRKPIAEVEYAGEAALDAALETARKTQDREWKRTPAWRRAEILRGTAARIRERGEELALLIASEGGKPLKDTRVEATRAAVTLEECAAVCERMEGRQWSMQRAPGTENRQAYSVREPIGVVLAICAFNHPLNLACHQAGTAIAAGNTCILKPASSTPISSIELMRMMREAGLPEGVLQVVPTPGRRANRLVSSSKVDFVTFIGSAKVGWGIRREVADGTRMAAEHGGNAASIVLSDADLDRALPLITRGSYYHAGQVCVSTQRLYVERSIEAELIDRLAGSARELVCGDAREASTDIGPLIEPEEVRRVHEWVSEARGEGAELLLGGGSSRRDALPRDHSARGTGRGEGRGARDLRAGRRGAGGGLPRRCDREGEPLRVSVSVLDLHTGYRSRVSRGARGGDRCLHDQRSDGFPGGLDAVWRAQTRGSRAGGVSRTGSRT